MTTLRRVGLGVWEWQIQKKSDAKVLLAHESDQDAANLNITRTQIQNRLKCKLAALFQRGGLVKGDYVHVKFVMSI